jgi:hypothetical protein
MFVGYNEISYAYMIFIPAHRRTILSKDVKFEERSTSRKSHDPLLVTEDEEQETLKDEKCSKNYSFGS